MAGRQTGQVAVGGRRVMLWCGSRWPAPPPPFCPDAEAEGGESSFELLRPVLVLGSLTAALRWQSLLLLTWGFLDQGVGEAEFWQEP